MGECPLCGESTNKPSNRLIKESCGHSKCRLCLLNEESGCSVCEGSSGDISLNTIESIGNFDYRLPATTLSNYETLDTSPRKLDFNKIPDDFHDCPLDIGRLTIDNSITQNLENVAKPTKVDISTETEDIVTEEEEDVQSKPVQQNTQLPQPKPMPTLPVANTIRNNHPVQLETPIVQNASFIPVTQRPDGRQFITIAFIANNSPNKNQHVVGPLLNQCLPSIGNVAAVQRPGGNQCIPMIGNINALQNPAGSQFIIRSPNIVQNLVGNQPISMIGNFNAMQNLTGNQSISMIGNVNAAKNLAANQTLPSFASVSALQSVAKGQSISTATNPNVVQNVVGNQPYETTPTVPKVEENQQPAPVEETVNTPRKQLRTRGLPRIKNVKNVNIVQKSATNQSDKVSSQLEKRPARGRRRKELPVYIVPQKSNEKTKSVSAKNDIVGCMSPEYKLEDYLLFNNQQVTDNATSVTKSAIQTEIKTTTSSQIISKPPESVINVSPVVGDQSNVTTMEKKLEKESKQASQIINNKTVVTYEEANQCKEHQDLNVIFNIRDENKQATGEGICDEEEKLNISNGDISSKEEFQNLDALFDIIEEESKKLNGGIFDGEAKHDLSHSKHEENEKMYEQMDNEIDAHGMPGQKEQNRENNDDDGEIQCSEGVHQDKIIEPLHQKTLVETGVSKNLHEINREQEQKLVEGFEMQHIDKPIESQKDKLETPNTEMTYDKEENIALNEKVPGNTADSPFTNDETDSKESSQPLDEETTSEPVSTVINKDLRHQKEESSTRGEDDDKANGKIKDSQLVDENVKGKHEINHALYEDISDEEKDGELDMNKLEITNGENDEKEASNLFPDGEVVEKENQMLETKVVDQDKRQELESASAEINDEEASNQCLEETTVKQGGHIHDTKIAYQDEKRSQNSTPNTYQDENGPLDDNQDSQAYETSDPVNNELNVVGKFEQSEVTEKSRGESKESFNSQEQTSESEILHKDATESKNQFVRSLSTFKQQNECDPEEDLPTKISNLYARNEGNEITPAKSDGEESDETDYSLRIDEHDEEDENSHAYVGTDSKPIETKISEDNCSKSVKENLQTIVVKKRRGRKKKSLSIHELNSKPEKSQTNQQVIVKKPRGRPKKSLANVEQSHSLQESKQPTPKECNREENQDDFRSPAMAKGVLVHTREVEIESSRLNLVYNGDKIDLDPNFKSNLALIKRNGPQDKDLNIAAKNKQAIIIKKRGRPKKSLSIVEQPNILPEAELSVTTKPSVLNDSKNKADDQQFNEKNEQVMETEVFDSSVNTGEQESLQSKVNANATLTEDIDPSDLQQSTANENDQPTVIKKSRGRPKKSLSNDEQQSILNKPCDVDVQPTAVKRQRRRSEKSLTSLEQHDVSQEVELSVASEISPIFENIEASENTNKYSDERSNGEGRQNEMSQHSISDVHDEERVSLHSDMTASSAFTHKNDSDSIIIKKQKVRSNKSLDSSQQNGEPRICEENVQPVVVKKRGRPKKSLSDLEQPNESGISQNTDIPIVADISHGKVDEAENKDRDFNGQGEGDSSRVLNEEVVDHDETSQKSSVDMSHEEKQSLKSDAIASSAITYRNDSDLVIVTKQRGRPKKSLDISRQQSEPKICDENVQPISIKKRGRPKKSLSNLEQSNKLDASQNAELSNAAHISNGQINEVESKDHQSDERNEDEDDHAVNEEKVVDQEKTSQHSNIAINDEEKESTYSDVIASSTSIDKSDLGGGEQPNTAHDNDVTINMEKSKDRPKKVQGIVVKKPRGRPKKSLSNLEQPSVVSEISQEIEQPTQPEVSDLNDKDHQAQSLNGTIDAQESPNLHEGAGNVGEGLQTCNIMHAEENLPYKNTVDDRSNDKPDNEQLTVIVKPRGRPKKIVKSRGRPKKSINEQHEHSGGNAKEQKSIPNSHVNDQEDVDPTETHSCDGKEQSAYQTKELDQIPNENMSDKAASILSKENAEIYNVKEENRTAEQEAGAEEVSQNVKVQDDENKENKEKFAEKDNENMENITSVAEQDQEKSSIADSETPKNNTVVRKYKSFDKINTQLIVESGKRKRKPKVLLYENEDLEISTKKRKKRDSNTPLKTGSRKSLDKVQDESLTDTNESLLSSKELAKSSQNKVKKVNWQDVPQENETIAMVEELKKPSQNDESLPRVNGNPIDTDNSNSNAQADDTPQNDEDKQSTKRNRRPKILLYENEGLAITPKTVKKKKVKFMLPNDNDSTDLNNIEKIQNNDRSIDFAPVEDVKEEDTLNTSEASISAIKKDQVPQSKTMLYENESQTFLQVNNVKSEIDSTLMKQFDIRMEPIVILHRTVDSSFIEKYDPRIGQYMKHESQQTNANPKKPRVKGKKIYKNVLKKPMGRPQVNSYSHIVKLPGEPTFYQCTICKQLFKSWSVRTFHLACVKSSLHQTDGSEPTSHIFGCKLCPKNFYKATHLQYHERMHKGEKPFACNICGSKFVQKYKLNRHMTIHGSPNLECSECGKKFVSKEYLKSHLMSHVQSSLIFSCNICPKSFNLDSTRKRHELSHSPVASFRCPRCPRSFKTRYEVTNHAKRHEKLRPFECKECGKSFLTKEELKRHNIIHTGEKKYTCEYCQQQYGRLDNYRRHVMHHHHTTDVMQYSEDTNDSTCEADVDESSNEELKPELMKNQLDVKPKKIHKASSIPKPMAIKFVQPLTPQTAPSPYLMSQNHELASVIRETLPDLMNAVPVISAPISAQPPSSLTDPIPLEQALVLNRQIEEKIYTQNSICEFPGLTRRSVTIVSRRPSYTLERRNSSGTNSNSNDGASFLTINQQRFEEKPVVDEMYSKKDIHVHWRRRTAESYKSKMDENK